MAEILAVVPGEGIRETEKVSWEFLIDAGVEVDLLDRPFGALWRRSKTDKHVNPFKLVRGEPGAIGDDGIPQWNLNIFRVSKGLLMAGSVDSVEGEPGLQELLKNAPDCNLLVPPADIEPLTVACAGIGHQLQIHNYEGILATSRLSLS